MLTRRNVLLVAGGLAVGAVAALWLVMQRPALPPAHDLGLELAQAFDQAERGALVLSSPAQVSPTVLAADGIPQRNAPSFLPRRITVQGAAPFVALERRAVLVLYRGDAEGTFAVSSLRATANDLPQPLGAVHDRGRSFVTFERTLPEGKVVRGVGQAQGARYVFVVGPQPFAALVTLADMIPPL